MKRVALARGKGPERRTRLRPFSAKRLRDRPRRDRVREAVFARDGGCRMAGHPTTCAGPLTPHHLRKSSDCGKYEESNLIGLCAWHNGTWVEGHPIEAEAMGLAERGLQTPETTWLRLFLCGLSASPEVGSGPWAS